MNYYSLVRIATKIKSPRIKTLGLLAMHVLGKRYLGIFIDPVLGCNYRCRMCYYSDENVRKQNRGTMSDSDMERIAGSIFHRALKLQIGCGAEPTLSKSLARLVALGKAKGIPFISLTTNGILLDRDKTEELIEAGLDEITISLHGVRKETYEFMMTNGDFGRFTQLLKSLGETKKAHPEFKVRINYTMNADNTEELKDFWKLLGYTPVDTLQLRPVQQLSDNTAYRNFDLEPVSALYDTVIMPLVRECEKRGITCLYPTKENISRLEDSPDADNIDSFENFSYCYISPHHCWKDDFDVSKDTFESYCGRNRQAWKMIKKIMSPNNRTRSNERTVKMNYEIK